MAGGVGYEPRAEKKGGVREPGKRFENSVTWASLLHFLLALFEPYEAGRPRDHAPGSVAQGGRSVAEVVERCGCVMEGPRMIFW